MNLWYMLGNGTMLGIAFFLVAIPFAAWLVSIAILADIAKQKGDKHTGSLWFIGLFATPLVLGVIVAAMPDRGTIRGKEPVEPELPSI